MVMKNRNRSPFLILIVKKLFKGTGRKPKMDCQSWFSKKWSKIIRPWKKDTLALKETLDPSKQSIEWLKNFLLSLKERKTFQDQILKKFFFFMGITGIISMGSTLFLFLQGKSGAVFYINAAFIAFSFLCLLLLIKRLKP